jgi:phosphoribosyl 1,2-cyclic phosphodiesterase
MRLCSIASGSSGNCILAGSDNSHILIDAGISGKRIREGLAAFGLKPEETSGIFITHEHMDHIQGLGVMARRHGLPIYATEKTIQAIRQNSSLGTIDEGLFHVIAADQPLQVGDLDIEPIRVSHDAADPVMYIIRHEDRSAAIVTDLGIYNQYLIDKLQGVHVLLLEANHDVRMLEMGSYPYPLKQRILGERGHLSNETSGRFLGELLHDHFKAVVLGHLSKENNYEKLAYETVRLEVTLGDNPYKGSDFPMYIAKRDAPSACVNF